MALSSDQVTQYYQEESPKAAPLSPLAWQAKQAPPVTSTPTLPEGFSYTKPDGSYSEMATSSGPAYRPSTGPSYASVADANAAMDPMTGLPKTTTTSSTGTGTSTTSTGNAALDQANADRAEADKAVTDTAATFNKTITDIQSGAIPLNAGEKAQVDALNQQFEQLITDQQEQNQRDMEQQNMLDFREGRTQYMPGAHIKTISDMATKGYAKISKLAVQQAGAVAELTQALKDNDIKHIKEAYDAVQEANKNRQTAIKETVTAIQKQIDDANAAKVKAAEDFYTQVTKPIDDLKKVAADNNASPAIMAAIGKAKTLDEAYAAAGNYAAQGTGTIAEYNYAKANGYTGTIMQYQIQKQTAIENAKAAAAAAASGLPDLLSVPPTGLGADSKGGSILAATGLSWNGFQALIGNMSQLPRDAATRNRAAAEATNWSIKNGVDVSTMSSQYKGLNDVVQKNIARASQVHVFAGEATKSIDQLTTLIGQNDKNKLGLPASVSPDIYGLTGTMSSVKAKNVLDVELGNQVNNPFAREYSTQIKVIANAMAGLLAAERGANIPELVDKQDAAEIVANGMNTGSLEALRSTVVGNSQRVQGVVNENVDDTRKQVWGLFGVGDKYVSGTTSNPDAVAQEQQGAANAINSYIQQNPDQLPSIEKLYNSNFTDQQVMEYLHL